MPFDVSETLFSPQTLLWLAATAIAMMLLFGAINRRRSKLTDSLREYVEKNRDGQPVSRTGKDESTSTK